MEAAVQKGLGDTLSSVTVEVVGARLGKQVAESGAAQQIATALMGASSLKNIQWTIMATGFIIGIPLFYNAGFLRPARRVPASPLCAGLADYRPDSSPLRLDHGDWVMAASVILPARPSRRPIPT